MLLDVGWRDVAALLTSATIMSGIVIAWVKYRLAGDFASKSDIADMSRRMEGVEHQMATMPTRDDLRRVTERVTKAARQDQDFVLKLEARVKDEAAKTVAAAGRDQGLTEETISAITSRILGIAA